MYVSHPNSPVRGRPLPPSRVNRTSLRVSLSDFPPAPTTPDDSQPSDFKDDLEDLRSKMAELTRQGAQTEALLADHTESIATAEEQIRKLSDDLEQGDRNWKQLGKRIEKNEVELIRTQDGVGKQMLEICENIDGVKKNQLTQPRDHKLLERLVAFAESGGGGLASQSTGFFGEPIAEQLDRDLYLNYQPDMEMSASKWTRDRRIPNSDFLNSNDAVLSEVLTPPRDFENYAPETTSMDASATEALFDGSEGEIDGGKFLVSNVDNDSSINGGMDETKARDDGNGERGEDLSISKASDVGSKPSSMNLNLPASSPEDDVPVTSTPAEQTTQPQKAGLTIPGAFVDGSAPGGGFGYFHLAFLLGVTFLALDILQHESPERHGRL